MDGCPGAEHPPRAVLLDLTARRPASSFCLAFLRRTVQGWRIGSWIGHDGQASAGRVNSVAAEVHTADAQWAFNVQARDEGLVSSGPGQLPGRMNSCHLLRSPHPHFPCGFHYYRLVRTRFERAGNTARRTRTYYFVVLPSFPHKAGLGLAWPGHAKVRYEKPTVAEEEPGSASNCSEGDKKKLMPGLSTIAWANHDEATVFHRYGCAYICTYILGMHFAQRTMYDASGPFPRTALPPLLSAPIPLAVRSACYRSLEKKARLRKRRQSRWPTRARLLESCTAHACTCGYLSRGSLTKYLSILLERYLRAWVCMYIHRLSLYNTCRPVGPHHPIRSAGPTEAIFCLARYCRLSQSS